MSERSRLTWADMAKGYGIFAVMTGHLIEGDWLGSFVYSFSLPLFFFLSGYLFNPGDKGFFVFLGKKIRTIIVPYICLGIPITLISAFQNPHYSLKQYWFYYKKEFVQFVVQNRYATLWYLAVLFGLNILMYFLVKVKNDALKALICLACLVLSMLYYYRWRGEGLPWNVDTVLPALPFFLSGYIVRKHDVLECRIFSLSKGKKIALFIGCLILNIVTNVINVVLSGTGLEMYWNQYGIVPLTYISAFFGIFFVILLSELFTVGFIRYIGENSLLFFLWHQAIAYPLLGWIFSMVGIPEVRTNAIWYVTNLILYMGLTCLMIWPLNELFNRTPLRIALGKRKG